MGKTSYEGQKTSRCEKEWQLQAPEAVSLGRRLCCPLGGFSRLCNPQSWHGPESSTGTLRSKAWPPFLSLQMTKSLPSLQSSVLGQDSLPGHSDSINPLLQTLFVALKAVERDGTWPPWPRHRERTEGDQKTLCS